MGLCVPPDFVQPFVGFLAPSTETLDRAAARLEDLFGPPVLSSSDLPFGWTDYYEREMGAGLLRRLVGYQSLRDPGELAAWKEGTNGVEEELRRALGAPGRPANLDPGYLDLARVVLATTKDNAHRIYLGRSLYAEVTLTYRDGDFRANPWTYPDYRSEPYLEFFRALRARYREELRAGQV